MAEKKKAAAPAAAVATDKKKALETALAQIEKNYGKGAIMRLGDDIAVNVEAIPTGSLSLDLALGIGGVPRGRVVEIYGPESSGKTTARAAHRRGARRRWAAWPRSSTRSTRSNPSMRASWAWTSISCYVSQPDTGEQALEICRGVGSLRRD